MPSHVSICGAASICCQAIGAWATLDKMTQAERSSTDDTDTTNHQPSPRPQTTVISGGGVESFYRTPSIDSRPSIFNGGLLLPQASLEITEKKTMDLRLPTLRRWWLPRTPWSQKCGNNVMGRKSGLLWTSWKYIVVSSEEHFAWETKQPMLGSYG